MLNHGTVKQQVMVYLLHDNGKNTRLDVAENIGRKPSEISRVAKRIIRVGWVSKTRVYTPVTDRWRDSYNLTDEGINMAIQIKEAMA